MTRASAVSYVLKHDCLNLVDFEQFQHKYNAYIEWLNVPPEKYSLNWRSLANRLRLQKILFLNQMEDLDTFTMIMKNSRI